MSLIERINTPETRQLIAKYASFADIALVATAKLYMGITFFGGGILGVYMINQRPELIGSKFSWKHNLTTYISSFIATGWTIMAAPMIAGAWTFRNDCRDKDTPVFNPEITLSTAKLTFKLKDPNPSSPPPVVSQ